MKDKSEGARPRRLCESGRRAELVELCDRVTAAAAELKRQAASGCLDDTLLPADVAVRLRDHLFDNPAVSAAGIISRATTFYFRQLLNCEEVHPNLARMLLAGRVVEPVPAMKGGAA